MSNQPKNDTNAAPEEDTPGDSDAAPSNETKKKSPLKEIGGPTGPEPTRYGDWEKKGRCIDF
ncbi:MAG: DUF1674 domain-containing protein [Magnetovibrionaceae bacterium]